MEKFTEQELEDLRTVVNKITTHIPKDKMSLIWSSYVKITGRKQPMPCSCPSSGNLWKTAYQTVKDYVGTK